MSGTYLHLLLGDSACLSEAGDEGRCEGSTSETSFLTTTGDERVQSDPGSSSDIAGADALGSVDLV